MTDAILAINAGSSSLKFALFAADTLEPLCRGGVSGLGGAVSVEAAGPLALRAGDAPGAGSDHAAAVAWLLDAIRRTPDLLLRAAGHRVVHGGRDFSAPVRVDAGVLAALERLVPLAPAHQPHNLAGLRAVAASWPDLPQVACFDTAFHRTQPRLAQLFPIPWALSEEGLLRYGFHGLSYAHVAEILPDLAGARAEGRVIVAHLGHGASLCALRERRSLASTMGFTALDGLMMGTRSGAVDPGLVLHLIRERGMSAEAVADLLNNRSGLLGVSGISDDVRALQGCDDPRAAEALALFAYRAVREAGSLMAALGGLDVLVFTAGIGEHAPALRAAIAEGLAFAGVELDPARNAANATRISRDASPVAVYVVPANEERPIARAAAALLAGRG
ncbi:acetate kinase [Methylobacterium sp. 4-46]|uniref:acetate/propionate family kinase n=1 Tax=unclassified Methylobacterium TaxID=2615210 RepID=UPI000152CD91|nr:MULTISPECIES: acetate/propionate family kinase [Methylobacterium]ACA20374.1 acetate kinase [Methylobacterium sp. 4-46]WFT79543.1 acetate/propionate family kinase [Methylobacterium nodulans]